METIYQSILSLEAALWENPNNTSDGIDAVLEGACEENRVSIHDYREWAIENA
jgi:hypothetical protein